MVVAGVPRALAILLAAASVVIVAAGLYATAWLIGPLFLALVIVITVFPVQTWLRRHGVPTWAATTLLVIAVYAVLIGLAGVIVLSIAQFATVLPAYAIDANTLLAHATEFLARWDVGSAQISTVLSSLNVGRLVGIVSSLLLSLTGLIGNLVFLLSLLLFRSIDACAIETRLYMLARDNGRMAAALDGFAHATRRYVSVNTIFGVITGAVDMVILWAIGVPLAPLWGLLVFLTNYIPYLGFWIGLVPPAILALLVGGVPLMLTVVGVFLVVNFVLTSVIQPKFVGDAVGLSVTSVLVALVFWGWLLGILGAVLATPLTLLVKVVLIDVDPRARWVEALIGPARRSDRAT